MLIVGIMERAYKVFEARVISDKGHVKLETIVELIKTLQHNKFDAHVILMGQNGSGKSMVMLALMKMLDENSIANEQVVYAFDNTAKLINLISKLKKTVIGIDEINQFFHYRLSGSTEQIGLFNFIEVARENSNCFISCVRDVRRMNNNYRDGKCSICLFVVDRYDDSPNFKSYAMVFLGSPIFEVADKFKIGVLADLYQVREFDQLRVAAEQLDTFFGYIFLGDIKNYIDEEELKVYEYNKRAAQEAVRKKWNRKIELKEDAELKRYGLNGGLGGLGGANNSSTEGDG